MNHMQIIRRAWKILWSYKALWIFGLILALTSSSSGRGSSNAGGSGGSPNPGGSSNVPLPGAFGQAFNEMNRFFNTMTPQVEQTLIAVVIAFVCLGFLIGILMTIARLVSQVAIVRMVNQYEITGEKASWRQGVRMGWSRAAWRLFLIGLVFFIPLFLGFFLLAGIAILPILPALLAGQQPAVIAIVATIGLAFLFIFAFIIVIVALSLLIEVIIRVCILEDAGVFASIRRGWRLVFSNFKDLGLMWLIMLGLRIAYSVVMIPIFLVLAGVALLVGGASGVGLFLVTRLASGLTPAIIMGIAGGILLLILIVAVPTLFVGGLAETYSSTAWTLAYRELPSQPAPVEVLPAGGEPAPAD